MPQSSNHLAYGFSLKLFYQITNFFVYVIYVSFMAQFFLTIYVLEMGPEEIKILSNYYKLVCFVKVIFYSYKIEAMAKYQKTILKMI